MSVFVSLDSSLEKTLKELLDLSATSSVIDIYGDKFSLSEIEELAVKGFITVLDSKGKTLSDLWDCQIRIENRGKTYFSEKEQFEYETAKISEQLRLEKEQERIEHRKEHKTTTIISVVSIVLSFLMSLASLIISLITLNGR